MKRFAVLLLCLVLLTPPGPARAEAVDWIPGLTGISSKLLEYCLLEHESSLELYIDEGCARGLTDPQLLAALYDAGDEYCCSGFKLYYSWQRDGSLWVKYDEVRLRPGLLMAEAYWNGSTDRLTPDEKRCLLQLERLTDSMVRQYGYETLDTELAIYDYICGHMDYRTYPSDDSRYPQCTSAANAFLYGWGNCQAYSDLFFLMTMMTGFNPGYISGQADGKAHLWNTIGIGENVWMVDVTYGDNGDSEYPLPCHYYFNFGRDRLDTHTWYAQITDPSAIGQRTSDSVSYYSGRSGSFGSVFTGAEDAARHCARQARSGEKYFEFLIRGREVTARQLDSALQNVLGSVQGSWFYYWSHLDGNTLIRFRWKEYNHRTM